MFKLSDEERDAIHKQHEDAIKKDREYKETQGLGLQKPDKKEK